MNSPFFSRMILLAGATLLCSASPAAALQPNILIFLADDLGYADVGFTGGKEIKTPHLDTLAAAGARLDQFYVQPVCSPTRAALMTGRYPMRYGLQVGVIRPWDNRGLPLEERILPRVLKETGYSTAIAGKWHLGNFERAYLPTSRGFDHQYGHYCGAIDYFTHERDGGFDWHRDDRVCRDEGYSTHLIAREAQRLLREQPADKPFFLYVPFNAVHSPHQVPEKYTTPYAGLPEPRRTYAGMVAAMDEAIAQPLHMVDWYPTLLKLAGASLDQKLPLDGRDILGVLTEGKPSPHEEILLNTTPRGGAIRVGDWKLLINGANGTGEQDQASPAPAKRKKAARKGQPPGVELFNLAQDLSEKRNLAAEHPEKVKELRARYDALAKQAAKPGNQPQPADYKAPKVWGEKD